jgi:nucleoid-associated protein YgaU
MSAYVPRHAPPPRVSPVTILLAGLDAAVLAVAVLALILSSLALSRPVPAALSVPLPSVSLPVSGPPGPLPVASRQPAPHRAAAPLPYTVEPGDSLWTIAVWYYGSGASWPRIWAANRAVIGPDPGLIRPGEHLTFP